MKKLIFFLSLMFVVVLANAQSTMRTLSPVTITESNWSFNHAYSAADSIGVVQDSVQLVIFENTADSLNPEIRVKVTELTSPARVILQYQARRSNYDSWTTITAQSKLYTGVGTDTTMYIRNVTGYHTWPHKRLLFITNSATKAAKISELSGFYKK